MTWCDARTGRDWSYLTGRGPRCSWTRTRAADGQEAPQPRLPYAAEALEGRGVGLGWVDQNYVWLVRRPRVREAEELAPLSAKPTSGRALMHILLQDWTNPRRF